MDDVKNALEELQQTDAIERLLATRGSEPRRKPWMLWLAAGLAAVSGSGGWSCVVESQGKRYSD